MTDPFDGRDFTRPYETPLSAFIKGHKYTEPLRRADILRKAGFDFIAQIAAGKTLLVGEGNMSFTLSLTKDSGD